MKVPIQNLYYLLCFAWKYIPEELALDVGAIPASSDVLELFAHVLVTGTDRLLRLGLDRGYTPFEERTPRLRGRIQMTNTVKSRTWSKPEAVCQFDDLTPNVLHNQIIRATVVLLARVPTINSKLKDRLRATSRGLSGIDLVQVTDASFRRVQLHRNNGYYAFLLSICRLVHSLRLPDPTGGSGYFRDLFSDEKIMERVFEEFLRNFYKLKQTVFKNVGSVQLNWNAQSVGDGDLTLLPEMRTDVTLRGEGRTIVMDAKYYKDALHQHYGARKADSSNLYQLLAYLRAEDAQDGHWRPEGILIYPVGGSRVDAKFVIDEYLVRVYTLDLDQDWRGIERDLLELINPISPCGMPITGQPLPG